MFNNNLLTKTQLIINDIISKLKLYIENRKNLLWIIPFINIINANQNLTIVIIIIAFLYFSSFIINIVFLYVLFDSIIRSLLILHGLFDKFNTQSLAKNIILLSILYFNIGGSLITLFISIFMYLELNEFILKLLFKTIELSINFLSSNMSFIMVLFPHIKLINYHESINLTSEIDTLSDFYNKPDLILIDKIKKQINIFDNLS